MAEAYLPDRGLVEVAGPEARALLDRLVTNDLARLSAGQAGYGALLSPQGKILADFIVVASGEDAFILDTHRDWAPDLAKRLGLYRLRAKVQITDVSDRLGVVASWDGPARGGIAVADPRHPALGWRVIVPSDGTEPSGRLAYDRRRIALGIPEGGHDFGPGEVFPHEALLDQVGGVAFDKGCYVGQEVVSRMQHRGTARTRFVPVSFAGDAPASGAPVTAGERSLGRTASASGGIGLALLRLDRTAEALAAGEVIRAGDAVLSLHKPDFVRFQFPGEAVGAAALAGNPAA